MNKDRKSIKVLIQGKDGKNKTDLEIMEEFYKEQKQARKKSI